MDKWVKKESLMMIMMILAIKLTSLTCRYVSSNKKCSVPCKYNENFLKFKFTSTMKNYQTVSKCMVCGCKFGFISTTENDQTVSECMVCVANYQILLWFQASSLTILQFN